MSKNNDERFGPLVAWRGVTVALDGAEASCSFTRDDGAVLRFRLSGADADAFSVALVGLLHARRSGVHSERSSGSPIASVSTPQEGENV